MSDDSINRQAAIRWVKTECNPYGKPTLEFESGRKVIEHLKQMPSAEPEQKTGRWIYNPYYVCYECSECGEQALEKFTVNERTLDRDYDEVLSEYCPHCGSRMLEIEEEEDEW